MISKILTTRKVATNTMKRLVGRLNHVGYILPTGRYFLNWLRKLLQRCQDFGDQTISEAEDKDLELWKLLLMNVTEEGFSINNITCTTPDLIIWTDACEHGIGGYYSNGRCWRWYIPVELQGIFSINLLEFLGSLMGIHMAIWNNPDIPHMRILAMTDSSSELCWLYKA